MKSKIDIKFEKIDRSIKRNAVLKILIDDMHDFCRVYISEVKLDEWKFINKTADKIMEVVDDE